jgi:hypothetical protein
MNENSEVGDQPPVNIDLLVIPLGNEGIILIDLARESVTRIGRPEVNYLSEHTNFPEGDFASMSVQLAGRIARDTEQARLAAGLAALVKKMNDEAGLPPGSVVAAFTGPSSFMIPVARGVRISEAK